MTDTTPFHTPHDHALIGLASTIPATQPTPFISYTPLTLAPPDRIVPLQLKVSFPAPSKTTTPLPIILLSHGHGLSNNLASHRGYSPLSDYWASHGFVVIQPTHLSSKTLSLGAETPGAPLFWRERVQDMKYILDNLSNIEESVPLLKGRLDAGRVAVAGHSLGSHTSMMLLGMTLTVPETGEVVDMHDSRVKAGLLLAPLGDGGNGGKDLSEGAFEHYTFLRDPNFSKMKTPTLLVAGGEDVSPHLTTRAADWHEDPFRLGPPGSGKEGEKVLVELKGAGHMLGGISGYDANETTDDSVERLEVVRRVSGAWLRSALFDGGESWGKVKTVLKGLEGVGRVEEK